MNPRGSALPPPAAMPKNSFAIVAIHRELVVRNWYCQSSRILGNTHRASSSNTVLSLDFETDASTVRFLAFFHVDDLTAISSSYLDAFLAASRLGMELERQTWFLARREKK